MRSASRFPRRARRLVLASAVLLLPAVRAGAAEGLLVSLDYEVDAGAACPTAAEFQAGVARELGYDPFRATARRRIVVRLRASGGHVEGQVVWRGAGGEWEGERGFSSRRESCAQIARAMALATSIQIHLLTEAAKGASPSPAPDARSPPPAGNVPSSPSPPAPVAAPATPTTPTPTPVDGDADATVATTSPAESPAEWPEREPIFAVGLGGGVLWDFGDAPGMVVPRLSVSVGRPTGIGVRLAASGFGPEAEVVRPEGNGRIDRFVMALSLVRCFRAGHVVQPLVSVGGGWHRLHARGFSAMPSVAAAHDGHVLSGLATASGGVAFVLDRRISIVVEVEGLLFWPAAVVRIGTEEVARFGSATLLAHAGLLVRF